jgi:hypothetical protein
MMCRVIAPFVVALFRREAASHPPLRHPLSTPLHRRVRIARHRALRWFNAPVGSLERGRRDRDLGPSLWRYDFRPWPALLHAQMGRPPRQRARVAALPFRPIG